MRRLAGLVLLAWVGCKAPPPPAPVDAGPPPVVSQAILNRPVQTQHAEVRHILIGWAELAHNYGQQRMDRRARHRTRAEAEELVRSIEQRLHDGEDFSALEKQFSEDFVAAQTDQIFQVRPDGELEPQFQALALRLNVGETGVCQSAYGFHLMQRLK